MRAFDTREDTPYEYGFGNYLALLSLRRQYGKVIRHRMRTDHGRECKPGEMQAIAKYYGGIRAMRLAEHGELNHHDPLLFAGDELLVYGSIYSVVEGSDVVFVTRDPLFLDQFTELMGLWLSDYVASEYGRQFEGDRKAFPKFAANECGKDLAKPLGTACAGKLRRGWDKGILPREPYLINLHCWLLGRDSDNSVRLAAMTFCGERGMHNLLRIKGATGRNTDMMEGMNIRAGLNGHCGEEATLTFWQDRMIPFGSPEFPSDDRLDLRIPGIAAVDVSRVYTELSQIILPWYENDS